MSDPIIIKVSAFGGATEAEIAVDRGTTLLGGLNYAGKTSVALAAASALTGTPLPVPDINKASSGALVKTGFAEGMASVSWKTGKVEHRWPGGAVTAEGLPPASNPFAVGLLRLRKMEPKERLKTLRHFAKSDPTHEDLRDAFVKENIDAGLADRVWDAIKKDGWDAALTRARDTGTRLKGRWEQVTGANYGSKIVTSWLPDGWTHDLDAASLDGLKRAAQDSGAALERLTSGAAVDKAESDRLAAEAGRLDALKAAEDEAAEKVRKAKSALIAARTTRNSLPKGANNSAGIPCPHCNEPIIVIQADLVGEFQLQKAPPAPAKDEARRIAKEIMKADAGLINAENALRNAEAEERRLSGELSVAQRAADTLARMPKADAQASQEAIDAAREAVRIAEARVKIFEAKTDAYAVAANLAINQKMVEILAPDGLAKTKLANSLAEVNKKLAEISKAANWKCAVSVDESATLKYGGRSTLLSRSEKYRVDATWAIFAALEKRVDMCVFDGADILDSSGRFGLISALAAYKLPALVCMTFNKKAEVPDLAKHGLGRSYWIADGTAEIIASEPKQAAA
jgi:hypothetical protein